MEIITILKQFNILYSSGKLNPNSTRIIKADNKLYEKIITASNFLPNDTSIRERLYCIKNNIGVLKCCPVCESPLKIKSTGKLEYPTYCSRSCAYASKQRQKNKAETMLDRYGVEYTAQNPKLLKKMKNTCTERHGVDNVFKSTKVQSRIKQTVLAKYNVTNVMYDDGVKTKQKIACNNKDFDSINDKIQTTTFRNSGYYNILQHHLSQDQLTKLDDYNNLDQLHNKNYLTLSEIAKNINVDASTISLRFKKMDINVQRFAHSVGEKELFLYVNGLITDTVVQGDRTILQGKELDVYIPSLKLAFEYNGLYWHSEQQGKDKHYHNQKYNMCKQQGIQLITIFEDEWQQRNTQVKARISSLLHKDDRIRVFARKTKIIELTHEQKKIFFDINHIQGNGPGSINIGLEYDGELVAAMSFIKQKTQHYLNRYATSCTVVGGFSKLLKYFQRNYEWQKLISFADQRWSNGNLYEKTGWELDSIIPPDYSYSPDGKNRIHKFNYRRKNLPKLLNKFDPSLSERINCNNNNILRIWDCGKKRYVMNNLLS